MLAKSFCLQCRFRGCVRSFGCLLLEEQWQQRGELLPGYDAGIQTVFVALWQPRGPTVKIRSKGKNPRRLLYLGKEYPKGADYFRARLKAAFLKNKDVQDPEKIKQLIARGEFVIKELEALYFLRKYRALKQRYYEDDK